MRVWQKKSSASPCVERERVVCPAAGDPRCAARGRRAVVLFPSLPLLPNAERCLGDLEVSTRDCLHLLQLTLDDLCLKILSDVDRGLGGEDFALVRKRKRGPAATPCSPLHPSSSLSFLLSSCSTWSSLPSPVSLPEPSDRPPLCRPPPRQSSPRPHRSERSPPPPSGGRLPALEHTRSVLSSSYIPQSDDRELDADSSASSCLALLVALGFGWVRHR